MEPVDRDVYFEDVRLQMEAKLWGEEYNRHRPPKQVWMEHLINQWVIPLIDGLIDRIVDFFPPLPPGGHHADVCDWDDGASR